VREGARETEKDRERERDLCIIARTVDRVTAAGTFKETFVVEIVALFVTKP